MIGNKTAAAPAAWILSIQVETCGLHSLTRSQVIQMAPCLEARSFNKKVEFITFKQRSLLGTSPWTCVCRRTSSIVEGGPLRWGGDSHYCIYMIEWTWLTSGNAHHPGRRRSQAWCACAVASSSVRLNTRRSSWAGKGGRSHTPHKTGGWAPGLFVWGSTSSFAVINKWRRGRDEWHYSP